MRNTSGIKMAGATEVKLRLPGNLYRRLKRTARLAQCDTQDVIVSAIETSLPPLPDDIPLDLATDLAQLMMLNSHALQAIADANLPKGRRRRFTNLLRREQEGRLSAREQIEWESLKQEYLRVSQNKAKARFILEQRSQAQIGKGKDE